jgi:hypothetical protein
MIKGVFKAISMSVTWRRRVCWSFRCAATALAKRKLCTSTLDMLVVTHCGADT